MTTRTATSLAADQRALSSALAYLDELKAEREVASDSRTRDLLSELIREQAECVRRLQTWIDGGEVVIAALFVATGGCYFNLDGVDPWDVTRDARKYDGPHPVVAHPPCQLWVNLAAVNWKRYGRQKPAWYEGGDDGGCFESALSSVRRFGGVLEHPAGSHAWAKHGLMTPQRGRWMHFWSADTNDGPYRSNWTTEVWQSVYGHKARKRTWLLYSNHRTAPVDLDWRSEPGTHQVGWFDRIKPTLSKREAMATPTAFRDALIGLARNSNLSTRAA